jgi:hypothetical protein
VVFTRDYTQTLSMGPLPTPISYQVPISCTIQTDKIKKKLVKTRKNGFGLTQSRSKYCKRYLNETTFKNDSSGIDVAPLNMNKHIEYLGGYPIQAMLNWQNFSGSVEF